MLILADGLTGVSFAEEQTCWETSLSVHEKASSVILVKFTVDESN
jgi:hypothetical protein